MTNGVFMENIKIRIAEKADADLLVQFNQAMAFETEGKTLEHEKISNGVRGVFADAKNGFYVVAETTNKEVIGGLMVTYEWTDWRNGIFWWIQSVYITPEFRGKGIYSMMYDFVKREAQKAGNVRGFRLYVEKENVNAQKVYEKLGMNETHYKMYEEIL